MLCYASVVTYSSKVFVGCRVQNWNYVLIDTILFLPHFVLIPLWWKAR